MALAARRRKEQCHSTGGFGVGDLRTLDKRADDARRGEDAGDCGGSPAEDRSDDFVWRGVSRDAAYRGGTCADETTDEVNATLGLPVMEE